MQTCKKNQIIIYLMFILFISLNFYSCKVNEDVVTFQDELDILNKYLLDNNITTIPTNSGLYYIELLEGSGEDADDGDTVTVKYTGKFLNGLLFDSGTFSFTVGKGEVISGFDKGIAFMKEGGKARLIIPSNLAYGSTGQNAFEQARQFTATTKVNAMAITKLDGTAKGGVVIGISDQLKIPVKYIGIGEKLEDLLVFNRFDFVDSLFSSK